MTKEYKIKLLDHNLSVQILLENMLYTHICDNYESMREVNPVITQIIRNDINTLHRNHEFLMQKLRPVLNLALIEEYESLRILISDFLERKTYE